MGAAARTPGARRADGVPDSISWTERGSADAFLILDRNGNGSEDEGSELFGDAVPLSDGSISSHGYIALAELDSRASGGNGNGLIDRAAEITGSYSFGQIRTTTASPNSMSLRPSTRTG